MQFMMLFVVELQFDADFQESYSSSGTIISFDVLVLANAFTFASDGTDVCSLKSNVIIFDELLNAFAFIDVIVFGIFIEPSE